MNKIRKGDEVIVLAGRDRGRRGTVLRVLDGAVVVEGVNRVKKHQKPNPMRNQPGGLIDKEMPVDVSNVAIWNAGAGRGDRVGFRTLEDGRKVRFFKSNGEVIDA
jgi:large subunit ribosomal protein L24